MTEIVFKEPGYLVLLALLAPLWLIFRSAAIKRRKAMRSFSGSNPLKSSEQSIMTRRRAWTTVCYCVAFGIFVVALARPAWERIPVEAGSRGRDVLFLLDVSNSMLAEDLAPNRLERAKQSILDCVESLAGDRIGLVIFAGSPSIVCPLTTDYGFFRRMLGEAAPGNVSQGGTRIGDAIRKTVDKLLDESRRGYQDLILITDGGDQESQPEKAAKELEELGVFLVVVGVGDERRGAQIPLGPGDRLPGGREYMVYKGNPVLTRLESAPLNQMAKASRNGVYLNAGLRAFHLGEVYHRLVEHFEERMKETSETLLQYRDEFQWFLAAGLFALCLPQLIGAAGRRRFAHGIIAAALAAGMLLPGAPLLAQGPESGDGDAEADEETSEAAEAEAKADLQEAGDRSAADYYNEGHRLFGLKLYNEAVQSFRMALDRTEDKELRVRACYNLGNSFYKGGEAIVAEDQGLALEFFAMSAVAYRAALDYRPGFADAAWNLELARRSERDLRDAMKSEQEGQEESSEESKSEEEGEEGEPGDEGENAESEDMEESDDSGEGKPSDYSASDLALDLENEGLPPPMLDPEDIFQEESANNELRQKKGSKYQAVEKDW